MRKAAKQKKWQLSSLVVRAGFGCVCVGLMVSLVTTQVEIVAKRQQLDNIAQQVVAQTAKNRELQRTLDADDEAAYIERVARERLNYAKPEERVFIDMSGN